MYMEERATYFACKVNVRKNRPYEKFDLSSAFSVTTPEYKSNHYGTVSVASWVDNKCVRIVECVHFSWTSFPVNEIDK